MNLKNSILIALLTLVLSSCIVVKNDMIEVETGKQVINLSPKPQMSMSDEIVRSHSGDMIAFLPQDWFFVNILDETSEDIFATAVSPDYTMAAVFTKLSPNPETIEIVRREGVIGLARIFFDKKMQKSAGSLKQVGNTQKIMLGPLEFGRYSYYASSNSELCHSAVFVSNSGNYYEYSLLPMTFRGKPLPTKAEIDVLFNSILATIQY